MKKSRRLAVMSKRLLSSTLITTMLLSGFTATNIYYNYSPMKAKAATLAGTSSTVAEPAWNAANLPAKDTSGKVSYWYAGNEFKALNQLNDGVKQSDAGTSGHLKIYSDNGGARLLETTSGSNKAVKGNYSGGSQFDSFTQRSDIDFSTTWELMDTDAIWDDQYLFAQYYTNASAAVTSDFAPTILQNVENWYTNGFSYDGSKNSRPTISASGKSWFSDAEKSAVKSATVKTDGTSGVSATLSSSDTLQNAHLFAASIDEMYYNPVQVEEVIANLRKDYSNVYDGTSWQWARSNLWSRSFWGVDPVGNRLGFGVSSSGQVYDSNVANEFAVAPAFYLNLEKVVMARSASNAATSVAASTGLSAYDAAGLDTSKGIKFLIQDESFASSFTSSINNKNGVATIGNTYNVDYSGATKSKVNDAGTGSALVISAILYDQNGKIVYYGPLSTVTSESGKVAITIPNGIQKGTYTLALFEEQLGGTSTYDTSKNSKNGTTFNGTHTYTAYETDYQSGSVAYMTLDVVDDYHTGVNLSNGNESNLANGDVIKASDISGVFTSKNNTLNDTVAADDIYIVAASDWESDKSASNSHLAKEITIPDSAAGTYDYYIVVRDLSVANEYWASEKQTVDVSENATGFDAETWYTYKDSSTNIEWHYKLDGNGDIIGLYTKSNIVKIVDNGGTLNIPAKVAGRTVVKIGGGTEDTPVVPSSERAWTSLSLPNTVTTINDYAFYKTTAQAQITIPATVTAIGIKAFYMSEITGVKVSEMNGTIGSYAFGKTTRIANVTLKGGESGLTISSVAFADTTATDVTVRGNVQINKKAFRNNASLKNINISGNVSIGESAFSGCSAVTNLKIGGTTNIESYAFDGLTSLESLYVPVGTTLHEYSFNGATALKKLEADVALPAHSFENGGAIDTLVLDKNVVSISYDWEGHSSSVSNRTVYVKNENMLIQYYGNDGTYYSPLGSSGDVIVYVPATSSVDLGESVNPSGDGILTLNGYTSYAHSGNYTNYIKGTTSSVTIRAKQNIDTQMEEDGVTSLKDTEVDKEQTGIDAYYNGTILTTKDIDKTNMTVTRMYGSEEGENYSVGEFYVVRTSEFNTEAKKDGGVTEDAIASYEPVHAADSDLDPGATTGTVSVTVIVFYDVKNSDGSVTARKYYSTPVSIRVEEYTSKSYIEQVYGSYDAIADKLVELDNQIAALQKELEKADVNSIEELTKELNEYKVAYAELVKTLEKYVSDNNQAGNGYFGTTKDDTTGETKDVIFINGNPTSYVDTGKTDSDGNTIYKVLYDVNGDGTAEETYIVVKNDGVHVVDQDGYPVKVNEKDVVYKDTLGALKRQAAAQLAEIKSQLADCDAGLQKIKKALEDAGYNFDTSDDQYTQIVDAINDMAGKVDSLTGNLENANSQIKSYASALDVIYTKLTGSSLSADQISGLANTLNAIVGKIQSLQNDLAVAKATVTDLQTQLNNAENKASQLQTELDSTKDELNKANTALDTAKNDLATAKSDKDALQAQYEAAIAAGNKEAADKLQAQIDEKNATIAKLEATTAELETTKTNLEQKEQDLQAAKNTVTQLQEQISAKNKEIKDLQAKLDALTDTASGFKMTVDTANKLFGLGLAEGTSDDDVYQAIQQYVSAKTSADDTLAKIQQLVNSSNTGDQLVADVQNAIQTSTNPDPNVVDKNSASYKTGFADGVASVDISSESAAYKSGYEAGVASVDVSENSEVYKNAYKAGVASVDVSENSAVYKNAYKAGYAAGKIAGGNSGNTSDSNGDYKNGYNTGYSEGVKSVNTSLYYNNGYNTGYAAGYKEGTSKSSGTSNTSGLSNQINTLTDQVNSLTNTNKDLYKQVTSLNTENSNLKSEISGLQSQLNTLKKNSSSTTSSTGSSSGTANTGTTASTNKESSTVNSMANSTSASSNKKTDTTNTENTSSTAKTADKPVSVVEDDVEMEGSTNVVAASTISSSSMKQLGESAQTQVPTTTEKAKDQKATITLNQIAADADAQISSNGASLTDATEAQKNNALKIINWYLNNLDELGKLGASEIRAAANDENKSVVCDILASVDVVPSADQQTAIDNQEDVDLRLSSADIEDGALYLIVHESQLREGVYDVLLSRASGDSIEINIPDLSPVTVSKITVNDIEQLEMVTESTQTEETPEALAEEESSNTGFRIAMYILLIVAIGGLAALFFIAKKRNGGSIPFKRN